MLCFWRRGRLHGSHCRGRCRWLRGWPRLLHELRLRLRTLRLLGLRLRTLHLLHPGAWLLPAGAGREGLEHVDELPHIPESCGRPRSVQDRPEASQPPQQMCLAPERLSPRLELGGSLGWGRAEEGVAARRRLGPQREIRTARRLSLEAVRGQGQLRPPDTEKWK